MSLFDITDLSNAQKELDTFKDELYSQAEIEKKVNKHGMSYYVWTNVPSELTIGKLDIGKRVWKANTKEDDDFLYVSEYKEVGDPSFPNGGFVLHSQRTKYPTHVEFNEIVLHPYEIDFSKEQESEIKEHKKLVREAKKQKYENPLTGRKCSYKYSLKNGFITETGEEIPLKDMKFENSETGRMVSYQYAKQKGLI